MEVVRVTERYRVTIPLSVRRELGIKVGDKLRVRVEGKRIILEPIPEEPRNPLEDMLSILDKPVDVDAVRLVEGSWSED
ncbi:AbrB/MazE/SpoVT family DNA-binding domain-containing protein [Thermofilum pendens]|uniref:AbrB/MazE/SpoVT family DNA-binding domain-containing protein n=1 Tax=Thermofilum pendens TaxID=2269 RepID=UPI00069A0C89|nr:AbrB/MazE/SpoVT family DNA-binding domain-containing protein [Thermofilum pendens]